MYLTYSEYLEYGGALNETAFKDFEFSAEGIINSYTFKRLIGEEEIPEAVKRVVYSLIDCADKQAKALSDSGIVTSRSNDGVSESYVYMSPETVYNSLIDRSKNIVMQGLSGVYDSKGHRLLYRGVYPDE